MGFPKHMGRLLVLGLLKVRLVDSGDLGEMVGEGTVPIGEIKENGKQAGLLCVAGRSNRA